MFIYNSKNISRVSEALNIFFFVELVQHRQMVIALGERYIHYSWRTNTNSNTTCIQCDRIPRSQKNIQSTKSKSPIHVWVLTIDADFDPLRYSRWYTVTGDTQIRSHVQSGNSRHFQTFTVPFENCKAKICIFVYLKLLKIWFIF